MSCTPEERTEIERACNERLMRSLTTGDFQIHGLKWDTIIGAIQHMDELAPRKTWEGQLEQLKQRMALEARVAELEAAADEIVAALNEWMADTEGDDQRLEAALARYQAVKKGKELNDG